MIIRGGRVALERRAAWIVAETLRMTLEQKPLAVFGIVGGSSVGPILTQLGNEPLDWPCVHLLMADERLVPLDHPDSNYQLVASFVEPFLPPANLHPYHHDPHDTAGSLQRYRQVLVDLGGRFDVILLSAGADGHVASLFPGHETILSDETFFLVTATAPKPPPGRMSASRQLLEAAGTAVLLFLGAQKRTAFFDFLSERDDVVGCPAKLVKQVAERFVLTDCGNNPP